MKSPEKIKKMFDSIADRYDFINFVISLGLHKFIKKLAVKNLELPENSKALDLCCGTGDISMFLSRKKAVKSVIGVDFSEKMLSIANKKNKNKKIEYILADCTSLPFEDNSFDCVTISFGLRNIENINGALAEIQRVLKPNGIFMHLDFAKGNRVLDRLFDFFVPIGVKIFYKNSIPYNYLIQSKKEFYTPNELENLFTRKGLKFIKEQSFLFNVISAQICISVK